jgi:hypothetical protein
MPLWSRIAAGVALAVTLLGFAGLQAYSDRRGPLVQAYGTTYYNGEGPPAPSVPCKSESEIRSAIARVHAEFDHLEGESLKAFEQRAALLKGLPPLSVEQIYVITADDQLRDGETVLFIGFKANCVSTVFTFPGRLYRELATAPGPA